jgi:hypothetical protein
MSSEKSWITKLEVPGTSIKFARHSRDSSKLVCAAPAGPFSRYPANLKGNLESGYFLVKKRAMNLQTTSRYLVNNVNASWQLQEPCDESSIDVHDHFADTILTIINRLLHCLVNSAFGRNIGLLRLKTLARILEA